MGEVVSIFNREQSEDVSVYDYIVFKGNPLNTCFFLSPDVMQLGEFTFVIAINSTVKYWASQSDLVGVDTIVLMEKELELNLGEYSACFCHHPFQGLLFLNFLLFRDIRGLHTFNSRFSKTNYKRLEWKIWLFSCRQIYSCFDENNLMIKERKNFPSNLSKFERFTSRIGLDSTKSLKDVDADDMGRRFGVFVKSLWRWTNGAYDNDEAENGYQDIFTSTLMPSLDGFPWVAHKDPVHIEITNSLEYPISSWGQIEPFLGEDFQKIRNKVSQFSGLRIIQLKWLVMTYDGETVETSIDFKVPVCLVQQSETDFRAILLQFEYAFNDFQKELKDKVEDTDLPNCQVVLGWKIEISRKLEVSPENFQLMGADTLKFKSDIEELQNKLKADVKSFRTGRHSVPCLDHFQGDGAIGSSEAPLYQRIFVKPMFVYPEPIVIEEDSVLEKEFLERTSSDWWESFDPHDTYRDYFICRLIDDRYYWVFKNARGNWYKHGIYS